MGRNVAIIGGGIAGLAAAFELTRRRPSQIDHITIYQMGWRLGGKCATGWDEKTGQTHEHGLHVFAGFYAESFQQLRNVYDAWKDSPKFNDVFREVDRFILEDRAGPSGWSHVDLKFPRFTTSPGFDPVTFEPASLAHHLLELVFDQIEAFARRLLPVPKPIRDVSGAFLLKEATRLLVAAMGEKPEISTLAPPIRPELAARLFTAALKPLRDALLLIEPLIEPDNNDYDKAMVGAIAATLVIGIVEDRLFQRGFDAINDEELNVWLKRHGATDLMLDSPYIRSCYDYAFAYRGGVTQKPMYSIAAGTGLAGFIRLLLFYRGSVFYNLGGGTGSAVILPYYRALRERGVKFKFFHKIDHLAISADGRSIENFSGIIQAEPIDTIKGYRPLVQRAPDDWVWPSAPVWDSLTDGDKIKAVLEQSGVDFESDWLPPELCKKRFTVTRGDGADQFTDIIVAVPITALGEVCRDIIAAKPAWQEAFGTAAGTATIAVELRSKHTSSELGWTRESKLVSGYVQPLSTWADMSFLLPEKGAIRHLSYFCGPWPNAVPRGGESWPDFARRQHNEAQALAESWLVKNGPHLFPATAPNGSLDLRYFEPPVVRVNLNASERYIQSPPASIAKRLTPLGTGFDNLLVAGDWTRTGIDAGCVEAAVISGIACGKALHGTALGAAIMPELGALPTRLEPSPHHPKRGLRWRLR